MSNVDITEKLKELNKVDKIACTDDELTELLNYGLLIASGDKYINRYGKEIYVELVKMKKLRFSTDISNLILLCDEIALKENINKIYCMTQDTLNKYLELNLIIQKNDKYYYRLYDNELWRVIII